MQKNRKRQILAIVLSFMMLITGIMPENITELSNVKAAEEQTQIADGTVYFQYSDGQIQYMDETNAFTLKSSDKGYFKVAGASSAEWECSSKVQQETPDHTISTKTHYWIKYSTGAFDGTPGANKLSAYVLADGKRIAFTLKVTVDQYVELKAYIGNTELTTVNPYSVNVADKISVTFKARKEGETGFSWISPDLLDVHEKDANYGRYDRVNKVFTVLRDDKVAGFTVNLKANEKVEVDFSLAANKVQMKDFTVNVDKTAYIDAWNTLAGNQYVGISYTVSYNPTNTSNRDLKWENITPDIAEYSDEVFSNGIVPKKAGLAKFLVSSKQNPEIKHEVQVEFKYKYPLQKASVEKDTFNVEFGERQSLNIITTPANATEQRFNWTYSKDGIVKVTDEINGSITDPTAKTTIHTIRALKKGTVTVTGTPIDQTAGCEPIAFTVNVTKNGVIVNPVDIDKIVSDGIASAVGYMNKVQKTYQYDNEWAVITKYRTGQKLDKETLNSYYNSVAARVATWEPTQKPTDIARVSLALSAIGADITNVKGVNLAEMMYNSPLLQTGSNELIWCLLALDATDIKIPDNARWPRQKMVDALLSFQNENGGYGLYNNKTYDVDLTGMAFQALAPYAKEEKVQASIEKSLEFLQDKLSADYGYETSETCSQVILGLSALKLDPLESGFGTEEKNIISYMKDMYEVEEGGFSHFPKGHLNYGVNYMGTYQALEALESYRRYAAGETSYWDMKDVEKFVPDDNSKPASKPDVKPSKKPSISTTQKKKETKASKPGRVTIKKAKRSGKKIKLQWKKVKGAAGYQIWTSSKKNGKYKLTKTKKGINMVSYTFKQKKKKKVYIKVRAYKNAGKKIVYGSYSKVKTVK